MTFIHDQRAGLFYDFGVGAAGNILHIFIHICVKAAAQLGVGVALQGKGFTAGIGHTVVAVFHKVQTAEQCGSGGDFKLLFGVVKSSGAGEIQSHAGAVVELEVNAVRKPGRTERRDLARYCRGKEPARQIQPVYRFADDLSAAGKGIEMHQRVRAAFILNTDIHVVIGFFRQLFPDSFHILPGIVSGVGNMFLILFL